jgi:hypothetical protein
MISPLETLFAEEPAPGLEAEMQLYGRLCGRWRTSITYFPLDGPERHQDGEWTFGYALEGRAVLDIWKVDADKLNSHECGLCVRVYDPRLKLWRFTFHGPVQGATINMLAFAAGADIVQERYANGRCERWIFSDITPERFFWRAIVSTDGGAHWRTAQTVDARRDA